MLTFFRIQHCPDCDLIQQAMESMSLAHKTVHVTSPEDAARNLPKGTETPVLVDGNEVYQGHKEILRHLDRLKEFKAEWDKFQSDACYCDDEGNII